ncbi:unnamed protein product [Menidia menidia]|uniref:(Atlantic silverside) hypothetical protein n=1 Tax=Menidia menidia TaxID=238744 RepID=A0A8S4B6Z5_9TELE|nr:unnamed protein product [Menidia menidia]
MHHQDFSGEPPGTGRSKAAYHYRRGSSGASASSGAGGGGGGVDDGQAQAGSSSPALHHQPQTAGAQVKKKSGFQITSVTSAQVNVSGNNSLADDTESYDDMDESHTEDLSSSEMLDVSASRATDTGVPERSSSDETLNSLHGVDTPGLVSPNEPLQPHAISQGAPHHLVNGTVHHQHHPQQLGQGPHRHSDALGGEPSPPCLPVAASSPALVSKAGPGQSQRPENPKPASQAGPHVPVMGGTASDIHIQGAGNVSGLPAAPGPVAFDYAVTSGQGASSGGGAGPPAPAPAHAQQGHTQAATGSRFRVVKLDTNSEPFRKGRWTCTEYYEKDVPHQAASEAQKAADPAGEGEAGGVGIGSGGAAAKPPHTLQPYQLPGQDFTSPQAMPNPPQGLVQTNPLSYVAPQDVVGAVPKPVAPTVGGGQPPPAAPQQLTYAMDPQQAGPQGGAYATPGAALAPAGVRQPDFIQPTAPFQTQVQPPLPAGVSVPPPGSAQQQPVSLAPQLQHQGPAAPQARPAPGQPRPQLQLPSTIPASSHGSPYMPLTALQADLQPLLTSGTSFSHFPGGGGGSIKSSHLEDAQRLLLQHQGLLGLPRLGGAAVGEGLAEASRAVGSLAQMGMSAEASAFMVAAAAGLRSQHAEGEDDR